MPVHFDAALFLTIFLMYPVIKFIWSLLAGLLVQMGGSAATLGTALASIT